MLSEPIDPADPSITMPMPRAPQVPRRIPSARELERVCVNSGHLAAHLRESLGHFTSSRWSASEVERLLDAYMAAAVEPGSKEGVRRERQSQHQNYIKEHPQWNT